VLLPKLVARGRPAEPLDFLSVTLVLCVDHNDNVFTLQDDVRDERALRSCRGRCPVQRNPRLVAASATECRAPTRGAIPSAMASTQRGEQSGPGATWQRETTP
jgi:hypothetical protein